MFLCKRKPNRSRLSLDLSSPTSELPATHPVNNSTVLSPRYTEFKTYNSTFDGLQALENSNQLHNGSVDSDITSSTNNLNNNHNNTTSSSNGNLYNCSSNNNLPLPLMRVASLPTMSPAHSGKYFFLFFFFII